MEGEAESMKEFWQCLKRQAAIKMGEESLWRSFFVYFHPDRLLIHFLNWIHGYSYHHLASQAAGCARPATQDCYATGSLDSYPLT